MRRLCWCLVVGETRKDTGLRSQAQSYWMVAESKRWFDEKWEALSMLHSILDTGSVFILGQNLDLGHPSLESLILIHLLSQASIFSTNPRN
ncbi:hypothetical protein Hdeb2414_s0010g00338101 [Helianthus debilis subsp. tardiflorus]